MSGGVAWSVSRCSLVEAKVGKESAVEALLTSALPPANAESATTVWFALQLGPSTCGIFDAFADESGRQAHLAGPIAAALMAKAPELLSQPPTIESVDVLPPSCSWRRSLVATWHNANVGIGAYSVLPKLTRPERFTWSPQEAGACPLGAWERRMGARVARVKRSNARPSVAVVCGSASSRARGIFPIFPCGHRRDGTALLVRHWKPPPPYAAEYRRRRSISATETSSCCPASWHCSRRSRL